MTAQQDSPHSIKIQTWQDALPVMIWAEKTSKTKAIPYIFCAPVHEPIKLKQLAFDVREYIYSSVPPSHVIQRSLFVRSRSHAVQPLVTSGMNTTHLYGLIFLNSALCSIEETQVQHKVRHLCVDWSSCASDHSAFAPGRIILEPLERYFSTCLDAVCAINMPAIETDTAFEAIIFSAV